MIVPILVQIVVVGKDTRFNVTRDPENGRLFEFVQGDLRITRRLSSDPVIEVHLELGPARKSVQFVGFQSESCRVLITLRHMIWSQADQVDLQWHA